MSKFLTFVGGAVILFLNLILTMFTISTLWGWFIVPLGAPVIGWAQAYGLALIAAFIAARNLPSYAPGVLQPLTFGQKIGRTVGINAGALLIGWLATLFM